MLLYTCLVLLHVSCVPLHQASQIGRNHSPCREVTPGKKKNIEPLLLEITANSENTIWLFNIAMENPPIFNR